MMMLIFAIDAAYAAFASFAILLLIYYARAPLITRAADATMFKMMLLRDICRHAGADAMLTASLLLLLPLLCYAADMMRRQRAAMLATPRGDMLSAG